MGIHAKRDGITLDNMDSFMLRGTEPYPHEHSWQIIFDY